MSTQFLKQADRAGVYYVPHGQLTAVLGAAARARFPVLRSELGDQKGTSAVLTKLGQDWGFPIWYGANFDALIDCLGDPEWHPAKGHLLIITGLDSLRFTDPDDFVTLIEVLRTAAAERCGSGHPFWILLDCPARGIPPLPSP